MKLCVIIPTLNRPFSLKDCLISITANHRLPDEVLVIDQTAGEKALENQQLCEAYPFVKRIQVDFRSLTRARNRGMEEAKGDIIVFSDDDVVFQPDFFEQVAERFSDPKLALLGIYNSLDPAPKPGKHLFARIFDFREKKPKNLGYSTKSMLGVYPTQQDEICPTEWAMGYCFCIRKDLMDRHALRFDENLSGYAYNEDLDFTRRYIAIAKEEGLLCQYHLGLSVEHRASTEYRTPSLIFYLSWLGNRIYMQEKFHVPHPSSIRRTYWGMQLVLLRKKDKTARKNLRNAKKIVHEHEQEVKMGHLDYGKWAQEMEKGTK